MFHPRGGIDYLKLSFIRRSILKKTKLKTEPDALCSEGNHLLETYGKVVDFTDEATLEPLILFAG